MICGTTTWRRSRRCTNRISAARIAPAVIQATKTGQVFLLNRLDGTPLFPVEERPVPPSSVPGEPASPTQPFATRPAPLAPLGITRDDLWGLTPYDKGKCQEEFDALDYNGIFTPPSLRGALEYPGLGGGVNWGSVSVDPGHHRMVVSMQVAPFTIKLTPRAQYHGGTGGNDLAGFGPQEDTPYVVERGPFLSPWMTPCVAPPWGKLVAIDLDTGNKLWEQPLGTLHGLAPLIGDRLQVGHAEFRWLAADRQRSDVHRRDDGQIYPRHRHRHRRGIVAL